jgi:myo-inositol-1(or 4)-monophosphatase
LKYNRSDVILIRQRQKIKKFTMEETRLAYRTALRAAKSAGDYLIARFRRNDRIVKSSVKHDVKLDVDVETEKRIIAAIRRVFPGHGFLGEECGNRCGDESGGAVPAASGGAGGNTTVLEGRGSPAADRTWVVDPLDGTVNFAWGIPHFCTSIAFTRGGAAVAGVVYDPVRRELFSGLRNAGAGPGAFLNGRPIRVSGIGDLTEAVVAGGFFKVGGLDEGTRVFRNLSARIMKVRFLGSAALDLCYLACGRVNAYVQYSVHEWDVAAALLIAELTGKRCEVVKDPARGTLDVLAADPGIFEELKALISPRGEQRR